MRSNKQDSGQVLDTSGSSREAGKGYDLDRVDQNLDEERDRGYNLRELF